MGAFTDICCDDFHRLKWSTLPLVYDDSLTYLEMLARLTARVDHIVEEIADNLLIDYKYDQDTLNMELGIMLDPKWYDERRKPYNYCKHAC